MKKTLLIAFLLISVRAFAQDTVKHFTYPVIDDKVAYQQVVDVPGVTATNIQLKTFDWHVKYFSTAASRLISSDPSINQIVLGIVEDVDNLTVDFTLQIDCKDGKYRYRVFDIKSTVKGKENAVFFRKYLVNVPAETQNDIILGKVKGYSNWQKKDVEKSVRQVDYKIKTILDSLQDAVLHTAKQVDF